MLTEIISKTVADKTVDSILKRIERAVPVPEPGDGGFDAAMRQAFNMGAACMAAQIKNGPVPTSASRSWARWPAWRAAPACWAWSAAWS